MKGKRERWRNITMKERAMGRQILGKWFCLDAKDSGERKW
jgi:hypothetical protein